MNKKEEKKEGVNKKGKIKYRGKYIMRVGIVMYGLSRTLGYTIGSIRENIMRPLEERGIEYEVYIHTYKIYGEYKNMWSKEYVKEYENEDIEGILKPDYYIYDDVEGMDEIIGYRGYYKKVKLGWPGASGTEMTKYMIRNFCLALYSKKKIIEELEKRKERYEYVIIMRPDLEMKTRLDVDSMMRLGEGEVIVPERDGYHGVNDRMCIGRVEEMIYYGKLFEGLREYSIRRNIVSERYIKERLEERGIRIRREKIEYNTIRVKKKI